MNRASNVCVCVCEVGLGVVTGTCWGGWLRACVRVLVWEGDFATETYWKGGSGLPREHLREGVGGENVNDNGNVLEGGNVATGFCFCWGGRFEGRPALSREHSGGCEGAQRRT